MHLQEVVDDAVEEPLDVHLSFASEGKSIQAKCGADIGEDWLYGSESLVIDEATPDGIYLPFHLFGEALGERWGAALKEVDLTYLSAVGIAEAVCAQGADAAIRLITPELDGNVFMGNNDVATVAVETFTGRTDAVVLIFAHGNADV